MSRTRRLLVALALVGLAGCQTRPVRTPPAVTAAAAPAPVVTASATPATAETTPASAYFLLPSEPAALASSEHVLQRLRERFSDPPCRDNPRIQYWQGRYAGSPQRFAAQIGAILPMMALVLDELDRYHLPGEYALLPIAESWYRPDARGAGDHIGMWQIGRSTAHTLDLRVDANYDGRLDPLAATDAALRYLAQLHNRFGDWRLAAAAYNAGPQRVHKLIRQPGQAEFSHALREPSGLPNGTFEYLARIEALACLLGKPERSAIPLPTQEPIDPLVSITLPPGQSSLEAIARQQEIPANLLGSLNPGFRRGFIASNAPHRLLIPDSLAEQLADFELPVVAPPQAEPIPPGTSHVIRPGDTLGAIARQHGVRLATLFALNGLDARSILRPGQRIRLAP